MAAITAATLSKMGTHGTIFKTIMRDQIGAIDGALSRAVKGWGRNIVKYELPTVFPETGLRRATAQTIIYSSIVRNLRSRGFLVRILITAETAVLFIVWVTDVDPQEMRAMRSIIKKAAISPDEVDEFLKSEE